MMQELGNAINESLSDSSRFRKRLAISSRPVMMCSLSSRRPLGSTNRGEESDETESSSVWPEKFEAAERLSVNSRTINSCVP